jgi:hypothetical protein
VLTLVEWKYAAPDASRDRAQHPDRWDLCRKCEAHFQFASVVNPGFSVPVTLIKTGNPIPPPPPPPAGTVLLVKFGAPSLFGLSDWVTVFKDVYTEFRPIGPGGFTITTGSNENYNFQGVSSPNLRLFVAGDRIRATWFNASANAITFTPRLGFTFGRPDPSWTTCRR